MMRKYLEINIATMRPGTVRTYKTALGTFFSFLASAYPGISRLSELKRSPQIEGWLSHLARNGLKKNTVRLNIGSVRRFFADITEWGWKDVPEPGLITARDIPILDKCLPKPISTEDDRKLQEALRQNQGMFSQGLLLLRKTGMRVGELMDLTTESLERVRDGQYVLHVPVGKMHTERIIPVDDEAAEAFKRIVALRGNYLPMHDERTGKPAQFLLVHNKHWSRPSYSGLRAHLTRVSGRAGLNKPVRLHQLRHTYATELIRCGISLPALKTLMGHKDISMTLVYTLIYNEDVNEAYYKAISRSTSMDVLARINDKDTAGRPVSIQGFIEDAISKLQSAGKDASAAQDKKRIQRITERLRRVCQDIGETVKQ
jgi:site-specific recombinase XerD